MHIREDERDKATRAKILPMKMRNSTPNIPFFLKADRISRAFHEMSDTLCQNCSEIRDHSSLLTPSSQQQVFEGGWSYSTRLHPPYLIVVIQFFMTMQT